MGRKMNALRNESWTYLVSAVAVLVTVGIVMI